VRGGIYKSLLHVNSVFETPQRIRQGDGMSLMSRYKCHTQMIEQILAIGMNLPTRAKHIRVSMGDESFLECLPLFSGTDYLEFASLIQLLVS